MKKRTLTIVSAIAGMVGGFLGHKYLTKSKCKCNNISDTEKFRAYYNMLNQWLYLKGKGRTLETYFIENGYKSIAIYGMGEMGTRLYEELKGSCVEIEYAVDKAAVSEDLEISVVDAQEELDDADAIVVTPIFAFDEIEQELCKKVSCPIISLEEIVYELYVGESD